MKKLVISCILAVFLLGFMANCAMTPSQTGGAGAGAALGGIAGALLDRHDPARGALFGGILGGLLGYTVAQLAEKAQMEAAQNNRPVEYRQGNSIVQAVPVGYNPQNGCKRIANKTWEEGRLIADNVQEVCPNRQAPTFYR